MGPDAPTHWLWRHNARDWMAAAETELAQAEARRESRRTALTHARRAGGMALNAVLVAWGARDPRVQVETIWGRSYMDHLRALETADAPGHGPLPDLATEAARIILGVPVNPAPLVQLAGTRGAEIGPVLEATRALLVLCRQAAAASGPDV